MVIEVTDENREDILEHVEELGEGYMRWSSVCGQAIILALQKTIELPGGPIALNASSFTGAGMAGMGHMCGALMGGLMAIGLAAGQYPEDSVDPATDSRARTPQIKAFMVARKYYHRFMQEFGNCSCRDLQVKWFGRGYEWGVLGEYKKWTEAGGMDYCGPLAGKAARLAAEAIFELPR